MAKKRKRYEVGLMDGGRDKWRRRDDKTKIGARQGSERDKERRKKDKTKAKRRRDIKKRH